MERLTKLANKHKTDKGTEYGVANGYTEFYQRFFEKYDSPVIVEIGVLNGGSVKMLNDFFDHDCKIIACDIDESTKENVDGIDNIHFFHVDASDRDSLENLKEYILNLGGADIIIDDASHVWKDQISALSVLCGTVKKDGIYVIEDMHLGMITEWEVFNGNNQIECSPLLYILFPHKENNLVSKEDNYLLRRKIKSVEVLSKKNERQTALKCGDGRCITAIITLEE